MSSESKLRIAVCELNTVWEDVSANLSALDSIFKSELYDSQADIIILPEMFTTGFAMSPATIAERMDGRTIKSLQNWSANLSAVICGSLIIKEAGHYYNRFIAVQSTGTIAHYDKINLFSYAGEDQNYTRGQTTIEFSVRNWKIRPLICYDLRFPGTSVHRGAYDLLLYSANWPETRIGHWDRLLPARAIENQSHVIACNRVGTDGNGLVYPGHSAAYDHEGLIIEPLLRKNLMEEHSQMLLYELAREEQDAFRQNVPFLQDRKTIN